MPELKRIPQEGKMNLDLHERILPPGQYREALNVNVGRSETSEVGTVENVLGNEVIGATGISDGKCIGSYRDNGGERIFFFVTNNNSFDESNGGDHGVFEFNQTSRNVMPLVTGEVLNFHQGFQITGINLIEDLLFWTDDRSEPRKINIDRARNLPNHYNTDVLLSVAKPAPFEAASVTSAIRDPEISSTFLRDRLPRFSYRWRFDDGEYSVLAPFTPIVFQPSISGITTAIEDEAVATGAVSGFVNNVNSITLQVPITTGAGITSVELIYTDTSNTNAYIVEDLPVTTESSRGFTYVSQDPFRTLPGSQITRVFDAVPRRAKSQEIAGGRIVYGNYLQNYNLPTIDFTVSSSVQTGTPQFDNHFVKSNRTYEVGIVLSDESGRTTPVVLSNGTRFVENKGERLTINFSAETTDTEALQALGFDSYKVVVKQSQQEYYNLFTDAQSRTGDNASKVPIDFTAVGNETGTGIVRPSSRSIYVDGELQKVTISETGTIVYPQSLSQGTYEVEPVESEIDIFFESPTGGRLADLDLDTDILIDYYNCFLIGDIEANRIRMGFNDPAWDYGVRAHAVNEEFAGEERRLNTLIHSSGFFNSRTGLNQLNQFNEAEGGITVSLDPSDGSIQKLFAEDTQIIIWQEDKVSRSPIDKDFIYSAEGGAVPVTSNTQYLGTIAPYAGEYGISTDPGSFAVYGTRKYFTDKNRGVVIRLSNDGLTEISRAGMSDFFRDALKTSTNIIGSFDEYHNQYNLTIEGEGYTTNEDTNRATASSGYFTVSFEEDTKGWVSFKSFNQESGTTLNNTYYTFNGGNLYEHNIEPRNTFYGNLSPSYIDFIFNDSPSAVKTFNTIGYEGLSGWKCDYIQTEIDTIGTPPVIDENFITTSLVITGGAENTSISEQPSMSVMRGSTVNWIVQVRPISPQYVLDNLGQVSLTVGGVPVDGDDKSISNGSIFFRVSIEDVQLESYEAVLGGDGADLAFEITLLSVSITGTSRNANNNLSLSTVNFFINADGDEELTITADENYYIDEGAVEVVTDDISSFAGLVDINYDDPDDAVVTVPFTAPTTAIGQRDMPVNVVATIKPILTWELPAAPIVGYESPTTTAALSTAIYLSPRDPDSTRQNMITLNIDDDDINTHFIDTTDFTISDTDITNGELVGIGDDEDDFTISDDRSEIEFIALSNITTSDTITTINAVATTTEATLSLDDEDDVEVAYNEDPADRNITTNLNISLMSDQVWAQPFRLANVLQLPINDYEDVTFDNRVANISVLKPTTLSRLTAVPDITFSITQTPAYSGPSSESVTRGAAVLLTYTYPDTLDDIVGADINFGIASTVVFVNPSTSSAGFKSSIVTVSAQASAVPGVYPLTININGGTLETEITIV